MSKYMIKPGMRTNLTKEEVERRKRKEKALMKKMRTQKETDEMEEIRKKRELQEKESKKINQH